MVYGTVAAYRTSSPTQRHFAGSSDTIPLIGEIGYTGLTAFALNALVAVAATVVLRAVGAPPGTDRTSPEDCTADAGDPGMRGTLPPVTADTVR